MNIKELKLELDKLCIPKDAYCLIGGFPNESYCLTQNNEIWEIYYSERGNKTGLKIFVTEDSACKYFLDILTRIRFK